LDIAGYGGVGQWQDDTRGRTLSFSLERRQREIEEEEREKKGLYEQLIKIFISTVEIELIYIFGIPEHPHISGDADVIQERHAVTRTQYNVDTTHIVKKRRSNRKEGFNGSEQRRRNKRNPYNEHDKLTHILEKNPALWFA